MSRSLSKKTDRARSRARVEQTDITDEDVAAMFPEPRSPLISKAFAAYDEYIAKGGRPLSRDEINREIAERRGGLPDVE